MTWAVTAIVEHDRDDPGSTTWGRVTERRDLPTFYLSEHVQGFLDEAGAVRVARRIVDPFGQYRCHITAVQLSKERIV